MKRISNLISGLCGITFFVFTASLALAQSENTALASTRAPVSSDDVEITMYFHPELGLSATTVCNMYPDYGCDLYFYTYNGSNLAEIIHEFHYPSLFHMNAIHDKGWIDIDNNGSYEFAVQVGNGGNCFSCSDIWIYEVQPNEITPIRLFPLADGSLYQPALSLEDVNEDGIWELITLDARWEFAFGACHANSIGIRHILEFQQGQFNDVSHQFVFYYLPLLLNYQDQTQLGFVDLFELLLLLEVINKPTEGLEVFKQVIEFNYPNNKQLITIIETLEYQLNAGFRFNLYDHQKSLDLSDFIFIID